MSERVGLGGAWLSARSSSALHGRAHQADDRPICSQGGHLTTVRFPLDGDISRGSMRARGRVGIPGSGEKWPPAPVPKPIYFRNLSPPMLWEVCRGNGGARTPAVGVFFVTPAADWDAPGADTKLPTNDFLGRGTLQPTGCFLVISDTADALLHVDLMQTGGRSRPRTRGRGSTAANVHSARETGHQIETLRCRLQAESGRSSRQQ